MPIHDYSLANANGASFRSDLNNSLAAIVSNNSSTTAPTTTYAYMWWADTSSANMQLKQRNGANLAWTVIGDLDSANLGLMVASRFPSVNANVTASDEELNKLDGFTGVVADLNYAKDLKATGVTTTEFDYLDGVTSAIQTQFTNVATSIGAKALLAGSTGQLFSVKTPTAVGHAATKAYADGTSSLGVNGYQKFPSGLIMQWGRKSVPVETLTTVTLPIAFPNDLFTLHGTPNDNRASGDFEVDYYSVACKDTGSLSSFTIMSEGTSSGTMTIHWQAIGY